MIYFAQDSTSLAIKIGYSGSPSARRDQLQTASPSPLVLLGEMPGDRDLERHLHRRFEAARVAGEWYRPVPELLLLILQQGRLGLVFGSDYDRQPGEEGQ